MNGYRIIVADSETTNEYDLAQVASGFDIEWALAEQPGKLNLSIIDTEQNVFQEGANVVIAASGEVIFDGYAFAHKRSEKPEIGYTIFDRLRYLNNKDAKTFENNSLNEIFTELCTDSELPYRIVNGSDYKTAPVVHDNKSLISMITRACDETIISTGAYKFVRDYQGTLELVDVEDMRTNFVVGDASLAIGYTFESSIDSQTYNYIKLVQDNKDALTREVYIAMDSSTIAKWGRLQYFEKMDENVTPAQIEDRANKLLELYNRKTRTLKISALGDWRIREGTGVLVLLKKLESEGVQPMQYAFVTNAKHKVSGNMHTMDLTLEVL